MGALLNEKMLIMNEESMESLMEMLKSTLMQISMQKSHAQNDDDVETLSTQSCDNRGSGTFILQDIDDEYQIHVKDSPSEQTAEQRQLVKHDDGDVCKMNERISKLEKDLKTANIRNCVLFKQYQDANEQNLKWK